MASSAIRADSRNDLERRLCQSFAISQLLQVGFDGLLQFRGLGELGVQFGDEARHLFLEGFAVVFDFLGADVAAGREDVAVRGDFGGGGGFAEAGQRRVRDFDCGFRSSPRQAW